MFQKTQKYKTKQVVETCIDLLYDSLRRFRMTNIYLQFESTTVQFVFFCLFFLGLVNFMCDFQRLNTVKISENSVKKGNVKKKANHTNTRTKQSKAKKTKNPKKSEKSKRNEQKKVERKKSAKSPRLNITNVASMSSDELIEKITV